MFAIFSHQIDFHWLSVPFSGHTVQILQLSLSSVVVSASTREFHVFSPFFKAPTGWNSLNLHFHYCTKALVYGKSWITVKNENSRAKVASLLMAFYIWTIKKMVASLSLLLWFTIPNKFNISLIISNSRPPWGLALYIYTTVNWNTSLDDLIFNSFSNS